MILHPFSWSSIDGHEFRFMNPFFILKEKILKFFIDRIETSKSSPLLGGMRGAPSGWLFLALPFFHIID